MREPNMAPSIFRTVVWERLRLPLSVTEATCACQRHLDSSGWIIHSPWDSSTLQERQSNCLCRGKSEEATPPAVPGSPDAPSDTRFRTGLLAGQTEESFRFFRPPASNFARDHHHPHATVPALELRVSPLFVSACFSQGDAVCSVRVQGRHQRGVEGQLAAPNVRGDPCSTLPTDLSNRILHCKSPAAQDPDCRTRCSVVGGQGWRTERGKGRWRRRRRTTRNGSESILETR